MKVKEKVLGSEGRMRRVAEPPPRPARASAAELFGRQLLRKAREEVGVQRRGAAGLHVAERGRKVAREVVQHDGHGASVAADADLGNLELGKPRGLQALEQRARRRALHAPDRRDNGLVHGRVVREEAKRREAQRVRLAEERRERECNGAPRRKVGGEGGRVGRRGLVGLAVLRAQCGEEARALEPRTVRGRRLGREVGGLGGCWRGCRRCCRRNPPCPRAGAPTPLERAAGRCRGGFFRLRGLLARARPAATLRELRREPRDNLALSLAVRPPQRLELLACAGADDGQRQRQRADGRKDGCELEARRVLRRDTSCRGEEGACGLRCKRGGLDGSAVAEA